ncbi:hypothetical protein HPB47_018482, partial [Ixodes persulcatus]
MRLMYQDKMTEGTLIVLGCSGPSLFRRDLIRDMNARGVPVFSLSAVSTHAPASGTATPTDDPNLQQQLKEFVDLFEAGLGTVHDPTEESRVGRRWWKTTTRKQKHRRCQRPCNIKGVLIDEWRHPSRRLAETLKRRPALSSPRAAVRTKPLTQLGNPKAILALALAPSPLTFNPACACEISPNDGDHGEYVRNSSSLEL